MWLLIPHVEGRRGSNFMLTVQFNCRVMAMPGGFTRARLPTPEVEAITTLVAGVCIAMVAGGGSLMGL